MYCQSKCNYGPITKAQPKIHWSVCQKHGEFFVLNLKVLKSSSLFIIFKVNFILNFIKRFVLWLQVCKRDSAKEMLPHVGTREIYETKKTYFFGEMLLGYQLMATSQILHFFLTCNSYEQRYYLQVGWVATNNKNKLPKNSLDSGTSELQLQVKILSPVLWAVHLWSVS
jgi:hypothetical protein